jgi:hypothetical protein
MSEDLRNTLDAAFDSAIESAETETPAETVETPVETFEPTETPEAKEARERDEKGRFKTKQAEETAPVEAEQQPELVVERKRPESWKKEHWDKYDKLDAETQEYVLQREEEYRRGVGMYRRKAEFADKLEREFVPYTDLMQQLQTTPENVVRSLMQTASILYTGDKLTKAALIQKLAVDHGLTSEDFTQAGQMAPGALDAQQQALHYKAELERIKAEQSSSHEAQLNQQIEAFAATHPHFDDLRAQMAGLLDAQIATNLQDAYDKAMKLSDLNTGAPQVQRTAKAVQTARAAAVSPRSTTATMTTQPPTDRRSAIMDAYEQHAPSSRV